MSKIFNQVSFLKPQKSLFDLSHERKLSMNMGDLVPVLCEEVLPGDKWQINTETLIRMAPMKSPIMHRVDTFVHFFFVPNRIIWDNWQKFITGGVQGLDTPVHPFIVTPKTTTPELASGLLADNLGVKFADAATAFNVKLSALPFRAYQQICNDYYIDLTLNADINYFSQADGDVSAEKSVLLAMRKRAWEKDYFTSSLPWTQRGGTVSLPLKGDANVVYNGGSLVNPLFRVATTGVVAPAGALDLDSTGKVISNSVKVNLDPNAAMKVDLSSATNSTIEDLRRATKLQMWLEKNAKAGARYIEQILAHFGTQTPDYRLQRSEYLGGGRSPMVISEVLQTGETGTTPQGNMTGHGVSAQNSNRFNKRFEEHGFVIGIMSVMPKTAYMQGMRRYWIKNDKFDYAWPEFAQLGEQPVYTRELWNNLDYQNANYNKVFGYQSRYADLKYIPDTVHGDFSNTLEFWHMSRKFANEPQLNNDFVKSDPDHRIFAVTTPTVHKLYCQVYHNIKAIRPLPYFNNPSLL
jgi:post-segregation antitoxin (ccd killing protein)